MNNHQMNTLLDKLESGCFTASEAQQVRSFIHRYNKEGSSGLTDEDFQEAEKEMWMAIEQVGWHKVPRMSLWKPFIAAAVAAVILGFGLFYHNMRETKHELLQGVAFTKDIPAGRNGATLTLGNGKKIYITDATTGKLADASGVTITKTASGMILYKVNARQDGVVEYNTLSTANGEHTTIILPDNSKVLLNAASTIKYPSTFSKLKNRRVELFGEAYFEVSKDKEHPFIVASAGQEIKVLGTHFNINGYGDEAVIRTTLLEGSIEISSSRGSRNPQVLKPGQLALNSGGQLKIETANTELETAWIKNDFYFRGRQLESVMQDLARWYDVKINYTNEEAKSIPLIGQISRMRSLSAVLERIAAAGHVRFKINGKQVTVLPEDKSNK